MDKAGIPIIASDMFAASDLGRVIPWERDIPGPTLLAFLQELKKREEKTTEQAMPPVSMWNRKELKKGYTSLQGKSLSGLLTYLGREGEKEDMGLIPTLHEKLGIRPRVDDVIETALLGDNITAEVFTPMILEGLLARAAQELEIDLSEIKERQLRNTPYHFFGDQTLYFLVNYARRHKSPDQTNMQFLLEPAQEIRRQRAELIARAKGIGDLNRRNGGVLTYNALENAGLLTDQQAALFDGGTEEFLRTLGVRPPRTVFPASEARDASLRSHPSTEQDTRQQEAKDKDETPSQRTLRLIAEGKWNEAGDCRGRDPSEFVAYKLNDEKVQAATEICHTCPVRGHCERAGHLSNSYGVWGGTTYEERRKKRHNLKQSKGRYENYLAVLPVEDITRLQRPTSE